MNRRSRKEIELKIIIILDNVGSISKTTLYDRLNTNYFTAVEAISTLQSKRIITITHDGDISKIELAEKGLSLVPYAKQLLS